jgi:hypothetical protein
MALSYDQISAVTQKFFIRKAVDNIFDSNPLLQRAKKKWYEKVDGGTSIMVPLNYAQASAGGWYQGSDTLTTTDNDVLTAAEYQWKQIYKTISIKRLDELKNNSDAAMVKFVKTKVQIAEKSIMDDMGTGLYNAGTTTNAILGLRNIISTGNTVGGIAQGTYSWWQAQVDASTTTLSLAAMQSRDQACTIGNDGPSVIMTTRALYNTYWGLLQPQQRLTDSETGKGGFSSLMFNGKPLIVDSHCPTSHMLFLNEEYLKLCYHPDENFRFEAFAKPIDQNVKVGKIFWAGALVTDNCRMQGALTAITA